MLNDICLKENVVVAISILTGSNVTTRYAEIGATFNNSSFGLLLWGEGVVFVVCVLSLVVLKIL